MLRRIPRGPHMSQVTLSPRVQFPVDALSRLEDLERELAHLELRDKNYESNRKALISTIRDLQQMIARHVD